MQEQDPEYTLDEYWKLVEIFPNHKYEFVDGSIRMLSGGSPAHGQIAVNVGALLHTALRSSTCNVYSSDVVLQLTNRRNYLPDVSVSCDPVDATQKKALKAPILVVEVLSPSTEKIDRTEKLEAYQRYPTIQEILLVDSRRRFVEHYHRLSSYKWEVSLYYQKDNLIKLTSIDVSLTLRDIYLKVYLEFEQTEEE
ncbi:MAG: Uma2 family endonuclease [Ktedonobacteraceae bacterium]